MKMNITFLQDYRGVLTSERYFTAGTVLDTSIKENKGIDGEALVKAGRAKEGGTVKGGKKEVTKKHDQEEKKE